MFEVRHPIVLSHNYYVNKESTQLRIHYLMRVHRIKRGPGYRSRYSDSLRARRSGDRITVGARFSAPVQTAPGAHPASYTMGIGSFPGAKRPGCGVDHSPLSRAEVKERVELYFFSPSGLSWPVLGDLNLYILSH